jgi:hypothetical protein
LFWEKSTADWWLVAGKPNEQGDDWRGGDLGGKIF